MVFSSIVFLCVFLVGVFLLYTVMPSLRVKNALRTHIEGAHRGHETVAGQLLEDGEAQALRMLSTAIDSSGCAYARGQLRETC